jgi:tRNA(Ile)-lysidine synthase TilS/MesJ
MKRSNNILAKNRLYILALSGGPDSMFLLEKMQLEEYNLVVALIFVIYLEIINIFKFLRQNIIY